MEKLSEFFNVRGVKKKNFNVIKKVRDAGTSSALIEVCFIDNSEDMEIYEKNKEKICQAIANGIQERIWIF